MRAEKLKEIFSKMLFCSFQSPPYNLTIIATKKNIIFMSQRHRMIQTLIIMLVGFEVISLKYVE